MRKNLPLTLFLCKNPILTLRRYKIFIFVTFIFLFVFILREEGNDDPDASIVFIPHLCTDCLHQQFDTFLSNDKLCKDADSFITIDLLILIFTRHDNYKQRKTIRDTWLTVSRRSPSIKHVFLLGKINNSTLTKMVQEEHAVHRDILQHDFIENYYNLTLKTITGFNWAFKWCPNAKFIFKTDDDVYVNMPALFRTIQLHKQVLQTSIGGFCEVNATVMREKTSKYYVSVEQYPKETFPGYCSGTGYVTSMAVLQDIVKVYSSVPFFQLEDVFLGMCLNKLNYNFTDLVGFKFKLQEFSFLQKWLSNIGLLEDVNCYSKQQNVVVIHPVTIEIIDDFWNSHCPSLALSY